LLEFAKLNATSLFTATSVGTWKEHETRVLVGSELFGQNDIEVEAQKEEKDSTDAHHHEASVKLEII